MSQSGVASPVLSGAPDPLRTPLPGLTYQAGSQGSVGTPSYAHAPGVHQPYSLPQGPVGPSFSSCSISAHAGVVCAPFVGAASVSHPTPGGPVAVLHNSASLSTSASMSPSPVEGKHSFHFSDSDFAAMPLVDSTAAADMQCPEMAPKAYNMRGPHEIRRDMHTSGLSVAEVDVHSSPGGRMHHSTPSSTFEAPVLGTTASIPIPTPRKAKFLSGPYTFTVHSPQAVVGMVPPNAPHPEVIEEVHVDSLDDPLASRQLSSSPQVQVDSLDDPMARDPSSGHPRIPIASMDLSDCTVPGHTRCFLSVCASRLATTRYSLPGRYEPACFDSEHGY